jgi:hypothetical protein
MARRFVPAARRARTWLAALLAGGLVLHAGAQAPPCPTDTETTAADLHGLWHAQFDDGGRGATLLLESNPRWPGSLGGAINRNGERAQLAGDVDEGELTLEESADGVHISATWIGRPVQGSCAREIRGTWQPDGQATGRGFLLRRR